MNKVLFLAVALISFTAAAHGHGKTSIHAICTLADGSTNKLNADKIIYAGGKLVAMGLGQNRQDDGFKILEGECELTARIVTTGK
jgi:hypothetical protein